MSAGVPGPAAGSGFVHGRGEENNLRQFMAGARPKAKEGRERRRRSHEGKEGHCATLSRPLGGGGVAAVAATGRGTQPLRCGGSRC